MDFSDAEDFREGSALRALADHADGIAIKEIVSPGMIEKHAYEVTNFGARSSRQRQLSQAALHFERSKHSVISNCAF
jgi:hypothetical protein